MKIQQDQSEQLSRDTLSFEMESNQSYRSSLNAQRQGFQSQRQRNQNIQSNPEKSRFSSSKACWFNLLVITIILLILAIDLNSRSQQLEQQPEKQIDDKLLSEPQQQEQQQQQEQLIITKAERKVPPKQPEMGYFEAKQKYEEQKRRQRQQQKRKKVEMQQKKKRDEQEAVQRECTMMSHEKRKSFFFIYLDKEDMPKQAGDRFYWMNQRYCHFHILYEVDFDYIIDVWNFRQQTVTQKNLYINKTTLSKENKKMLFIFLQLYFWGGMYVNTQLGLKFGNYLNDNFIYKARTGKEILFGQADHQNEQGYVLPKKAPRAIRMEQNFSQRLEKMIRKIINQEDWRDLCRNYQCAVMKKAIKNI